MPEFIPVFLVVTAVIAWFNARFLRLPSTIGVTAVALILSAATLVLDHAEPRAPQGDVGPAIAVGFVWERMELRALALNHRYAACIHAATGGRKCWMPGWSRSRPDGFAGRISIEKSTS